MSRHFDFVFVGNPDPTQVGTEYDDFISTAWGDDTIWPFAGNDVIVPGRGADRILLDNQNGIEGHDTIIGFQTGCDKIYFTNMPSVDSFNDLTFISNGESTLLLYPSAHREVGSIFFPHTDHLVFDDFIF